MTTMNTMTAMTVADTPPVDRGARRDIECVHCVAKFGIEVSIDLEMREANPADKTNKADQANWDD